MTCVGGPRPQGGHFLTGLGEFGEPWGWGGQTLLLIFGRLVASGLYIWEVDAPKAVNVS